MILQLLQEKGLEPRPVRQGGVREFCCPCPACGGDDRFRVWPDQSDGEGRFWCRQCGVKGDAIQFAVDYLGKSFKDAAAMAGRDITSMPHRPARPSRSRSNQAPTWSPVPLSWPADLWQEKAGTFIDWSFGNLHHADDRLQYLAGRGIPRETALQFFIGDNPGRDGRDLFRTRESWGLPTEMKKGKKKKIWLPRGLVIPVYRSGRLARIKIRMDEPVQDLKYWGVPGSLNMPMVLGNSVHAFVIIEAELDALAVYAAAGDMITVVALGSLAVRPDKVLHEQLQYSKIILNALDADFSRSNERARKQNRHNLDWWANQYPQNKRWPVPAGKDPGEAYEAGVDLREWILAGLPPYLWPKSEKEQPGEGSPQVSAEIAELIRLLTDSGAKLWMRDKGNSLGIFESRAWEHENPAQARRLRELVYGIKGVNCPANDLICSLDDGIYTAATVKRAAEKLQKEAKNA